MKFILTKELGRLTKWLRILGYDSVYFKEQNPSALIIIALREDRIVLTRRERLGQQRGISVLQIKSDHLKEQIKQVLKELNLFPDKNIMFSRCTLCNISLKSIDKSKVESKVPEYVYKTQENFVICSECNRIYWQGTHWGNVGEMLREISAQ